MKTDDLIAMLGRNAEPVPSGRVQRGVVAAMAVGTAEALLAMLLVLGVRTDLDHAAALRVVLLKLLFTVATVSVAAVYLIKAARPGGERRAHVMLALLPLAAVIALAAISLGSAPAEHWNRMIVGDQWLECLLSVPLIAILPFVAIVWTVRRMGPTD